ncbi:hypothetical protein C8R43DRAFT_960984 [Mycena crocata]|nr:hypothetical protein C8R43DRAFT_960984 [Mycena crocata]
MDIMQLTSMVCNTFLRSPVAVLHVVKERGFSEMQHEGSECLKRQEESACVEMHILQLLPTFIWFLLKSDYQYINLQQFKTVNLNPRNLNMLVVPGVSESVRRCPAISTGRYTEYPLREISKVSFRWILLDTPSIMYQTSLEFLVDSSKGDLVPYYGELRPQRTENSSSSKTSDLASALPHRIVSWLAKNHMYIAYCTYSPQVWLSIIHPDHEVLVSIWTRCSRGEIEGDFRDPDTNFRSYGAAGVDGGLMAGRMAELIAM